jgi:hypothetical protein
MRRLWEHRKVETSDVASEPGVVSTSRAAQAMDIDTDSEQSTHRQMESEDKTPYTSQRGNMGPHESSELQQLASVSDHSVCLVLPENSLQYSDLVDYLGLEGELSKLMVLVGDFNISEDDRAKLKKYLPKHFHLELKNDPAEHTTLSGSCINLTFSRYRHLICKPYVILLISLPSIQQDHFVTHIIQLWSFIYPVIFVINVF